MEGEKPCLVHHEKRWPRPPLPVGRLTKSGGEGIARFVMLKAAECNQAMAAEAGVDGPRRQGDRCPGLRPDEICVTDALPKTCSGKIMRRLPV